MNYPKTLVERNELIWDRTIEVCALLGLNVLGSLHGNPSTIYEYIENQHKIETIDQASSALHNSLEELIRINGFVFAFIMLAGNDWLDHMPRLRSWIDENNVVEAESK